MTTYHHGNLREALVEAAIESIEEGEELSMRAVARRAWVSTAAPYRHFADRTALDSAVAVEGFHDMGAELRAVVEEDGPDVVADLAVAYVFFALRRPAVFRLMFGNECDPENADRVQASTALHDLLAGVAARLYPSSNADALSTALWSMAHGLAFLHLDGKFRPHPESDVENRVRTTFAVVTAAL